VREARPMDLRTRPFYTVRALRRLSKLPAPPACVERADPAPVAATAVAPVATQTPARADAPVVPVPVPVPTSTRGAVPDAAWGASPATVPSAPVRVMAKAPAAAPVTTVPATPTVAPASSPARLPTAPVKHGRAYDWTGLP